MVSQLSSVIGTYIFVTYTGRSSVEVSCCAIRGAAVATDSLVDLTLSLNRVQSLRQQDTTKDNKR